MERTRTFSNLAKELTHNQERSLIAVDGPAGSGKTTFANSLSNYLVGSKVVHLDEIYNGWEDALTPTLEKNLIEWIVSPFHKNEIISYPVFDWYKKSYGQIKLLGKPSFLIIEGVGAGNREVLNSLNYLVWVEADLDLGLSRVENRDGLEVAAQMTLWREREAAWFLAQQTKTKAVLKVDGNPPAEIDLSKEFWPL